MIQRIQSVYLAIVAILSTVSLFSTIGKFVAGGELVSTFSNFSFSADKEPFSQVESCGPWALGVLLIIVLLLSILTIGLFNHRMKQVRLAVFSSILLVGYIAVYAFFSWVFQGKLQTTAPDADVHFQLCATAVYPLVCLILNIMAIHRIRKDEKLVRSLDRIR